MQTGCFPLTARRVPSRQDFMRRSKIYPSSPHTAPAPPRGSPSTHPSPNPAALLIQPDHYIFRMLYSQGVSLESLGVPQLDGRENADPREVWRIFAKHYSVFRG